MSGIFWISTPLINMYENYMGLVSMNLKKGNFYENIIGYSSGDDHLLLMP